MTKKRDVIAFTGGQARFSKHQLDVMAAIVKQYVLLERARSIELLEKAAKDYIEDKGQDQYADGLYEAARLLNGGKSDE
jgi:hypothetical protein